MNIILTGFMGCGKTTVGKLLSEKLNINFIDVDAYIEKSEQSTVNEIFLQKGEPFFRDLEHLAIKEISLEDNSVISLGGGAILFKRNVDYLRKNNNIIAFINTPVEIIFNRLQEDASRPLAANKDNLLTLYNKRYKTYNLNCNFVIDGSKSTDEIVSLILAKYKSM